MGKIYNALEKADKTKSADISAMPDHTAKADSTRHLAPPEEEEVYPEHEIPQITDNCLETVLKPHSPISEQFRLLKNNILFPEKGEPSKTIMVTSASPGEGKSFTAANLAASIAQSIDEYVLLVDCDLRKPTIHSKFGFDSEGLKGLSDYLSAGIPLSSVLKKTAVNKLTILPAGPIPPNPSELLSSEQMRRMLHEVKLRYTDRYIIIDTPPPYITSETNAIARYVDGILLVVRQGRTRIKEIQDIIDIYGRHKILGVIKNFSTKPVGYGYGYGKYGYGKYGYGKYGAYSGTGK
ncbi:polysaccharide biosynthesis tyrosine autokinase [uncultured Desulfobacter sp.]|uniref:polysaccharide biosynthesis tyrosine autokinase n=1 Tax=uncultured Desulfobacter sp. TaxID=240139 RepID=UPI0029F5CB9C|nr:polysaccharide biosynthesis tyrosine autokinase [uncultured Desulfobacter sp.]